MTHHQSDGPSASLGEHKIRSNTSPPSPFGCLIIQVSIQMDGGEMSGFLEQLSSFQREKHWVDVCFIIEDQKVWAHQCIIAARSPVIKAMLLGESTSGLFPIWSKDMYP